MKIALDASYGIIREPSGVASYSDNIIRALTQSAPNLDFLLCYRANRYLRGLRAPLPAMNCSRALLEDFTAFFYRFGVTLFHGLNQRLPRIHRIVCVDTVMNHRQHRAFLIQSHGSGIFPNVRSGKTTEFKR